MSSELPGCIRCGDAICGDHNPTARRERTSGK
jgi:hypothetical protein